jgi:Phage tail assembly chaperone protein
MLWQLKKLSTGEPLNSPQPLPENWGSIFGMSGFLDKIGDLSFIGIEDQGWFQVEGEVPVSAEATPAELAWNQAKLLLAESDWAMLPDVPLLNGDKQLWQAYRKALREIRLQSGFPNNIVWPVKP